MDVRKNRLGICGSTSRCFGSPVQGTFEIWIRGHVWPPFREQLIRARVGRTAQMQGCQQALGLHEPCTRSHLAPEDRVLPTAWNGNPFQIGTGKAQLCRRDAKPG